MLRVRLNSEIVSKLTSDDLAKICRFVSWETAHPADIYPNPGRTFVLSIGGHIYKVKGAGFYNPPNSSFSGLKRTIEPVPTQVLPQKPMERSFRRDIIHVDPSPFIPYSLMSVLSTDAPIGGMLLDVAKNDQAVFAQLSRRCVPCNTPIGVIEYPQLALDGRAMGVSVSVLPRNAATYTPYDIFLHWHRRVEDIDPSFLSTLLGSPVCINNPDHRLQIMRRISREVGRQIVDFSIVGGLYRFSGSPDNWGIKLDQAEPLFFSDVDTAKFLSDIPPDQAPWEVLRNLISAIYQWYYFFLPSVSYPESGYSYRKFREYDFLNGILSGFFGQAAEASIEEACEQIWRFFEPVTSQAQETANIPLRKGEHFLQAHYDRPTAYCVLLAIISPLLELSRLNELGESAVKCASTVEAYIRGSILHRSHKACYPIFDPQRAIRLVERYGHPRY
ncbi:hypothetical protein [Rhodopseudomonas sp. AAP120]|uniref:hypothetical protein n=1 Tax=Rhodopseudomonas sp. AAP120 TaxID=1523430 RepID=UPI000B11AABC|nr:hypothetical protein [Rhodopseudomonas sp. AAP120]